MIETDLEPADGRRLHVYDTGADGSAGGGGADGGPGGRSSRLTVFWLHGTPNVGAPLGGGTQARLAPADGHISVLGAGPAALEWLVERAA
ncbi:hypothetical protein AB0F16_35695 [Streptomyces tanashiensis]|uniref:hypothetical protein n=1 Tax=Streptomyces tanashiensis TaxID=67367 RepID=UPI0033E30CA6